MPNRAGEQRGHTKGTARSRRQRDHYIPHEPENRLTEEQAGDYRVLSQKFNLAAGGVINRGCGKRDEEVESQAKGGGAPSALEGSPPKHAGGDGLKDSYWSDAILYSPSQAGLGHVEYSATQATPPDREERP